MRTCELSDLTAQLWSEFEDQAGLALMSAIWFTGFESLANEQQYVRWIIKNSLIQELT